MPTPRGLFCILSVTCLLTRKALRLLLLFFFKGKTKTIKNRKKAKTKQDIVRVRVVQSWVEMRPSEQATSIESTEKVGLW